MAQEHVDSEGEHGRTVTLEEAAKRILALADFVEKNGPEAAEALIAKITRENHDTELRNLRFRVANLEDIIGATVVGGDPQQSPAVTLYPMGYVTRW